jgi:hypothetical protein
MKRWMASMCRSTLLEKEQASRTRRLTRARKVPNQRSAWLVSPSCLPQKRWVRSRKGSFAGQPEIAARGATPVIFGHMLTQALRPLLAAIRDGVGHDLAGAAAQCDPEPALLLLLFHEAPEFILVPARHRFDSAKACPRTRAGG